MLLPITKFGGIIPQILDPVLIPENKAQVALNCRFDRGGITPLQTDVFTYTPTNAGELMRIYAYYIGVAKYFLAWTTDVDAQTAPLANDIFNRLFYTEGGKLRVTDSTLFKAGGTAYPMSSLNPSPPAPIAALSVAGTAAGSDPTLLETRFYTYTYVNGYGSEGPPAPVSAEIDLYDGDTCNLTNIGSLSLTYMNFIGGFREILPGYNIRNSANTGSGYVASVVVTSGSWATGDAAGVIYMATHTGTFGVGSPATPVNIYIVVGRILKGMAQVTSEPTSAPSGVSADYNLGAKRIYRTNQTASGTSQFQLVAEIAFADTTYTDTVLDAALGEVLATTEWDGAPDNMYGLISLPNGVFAGFFNNTVCFSVPYFPHAWPVSYQKSVDKPVVGLGAFGTTCVVLTTGQPYLIVGNDPANTVMERMDLGLSCMSKRGIVNMGGLFIMYPCPEGLAAIGPGVDAIATEGIITRDDWIGTYNPSSIHAYYWQGKYVAFYESRGYQGGFIFDPKTKDLTPLDFYAQTGFHDKADGTLYLLIGPDIVAFNETTGIYRNQDYRTKRFRFHLTSFGAIKVLARSYPVTVDVVYPDIPATDVCEITSADPQRMKNVGLIDNCEVRVYGGSEVTAIYLAPTMGELPL
jgi:hypothetical protein